jgi:hypothetical protein
MKKVHCACGDHRVADDEGTVRQALAHEAHPEMRLTKGQVPDPPRSRPPP